ncbi:MAG: MFS transporter [Verrucomicrobiota bacterium]|nr:MFS transporter [Verrucomicrobiota bacterium]MDD8047003.1 MFS transporter [Verrucomicrobiota bacterium]
MHIGRKRSVRRNFIFHLLDGVFFMAGLSLTSSEIVTSVLIHRLGGGAMAVGGVFALFELGYNIPQLIAAPFVEGVRRKKTWVLIGGFLQRVPWLAVAWLLMVRGPTIDSSAIAPILTLIGIAAFTAGFCMPAWHAFLAGTVPLRTRGRLLALRQAFGGVIGIVSGLIAAYILKQLLFPHNFAILFGLTFLFWMISWATLAFVTEEDHQTRTHRDFKAYFQDHILVILTGDRWFRQYLLIKAIMLASMISFGFFAVHGVERFESGTDVAGLFTSIYMIGQIASAYLFGYLADRFGHKVNILIFGVLTLIQAAAAILAPSLTFYGLVFILMGANRCIQAITFNAMPMEYCTSSERPTYFALSNSLLSPLLLIGVLGGLLTPAIGYHGLFLISGVFGVLVLLIGTRLKDPRSLPNFDPIG